MWQCKILNLASIYLLKVNNENTRTKSEICPKLTIKTPERLQLRRSGVPIANFEQISHFLWIFPLLTLNKYMPTWKGQPNRNILFPFYVPLKSSKSISFIPFLFLTVVRHQIVHFTIFEIDKYKVFKCTLCFASH